jgi:hypothetical protein
MKHSLLWVLMVGSLGAGVLMIFSGGAAGSDIGQLMAGYGLLVIGSSLFLGFGLAIQALVHRAIARPRREVSSAGTAVGHRI